MEKPKCDLPDEKSSIYYMMEVVSSTLLNVGQIEQAISFNARIMKCNSREKVINVIEDYVTVI